jgi:hypothetical protein
MSILGSLISSSPILDTFSSNSRHNSKVTTGNSVSNEKLIFSDSNRQHVLNTYYVKGSVHTNFITVISFKYCIYPVTCILAPFWRWNTETRWVKYLLL